MIPLDQLEKLLHRQGYRLTRPRRVVFEFFMLAKEPIQLHQILKALGPVIDRASIYRAIKLFQDIDIIHQVHRPGRTWLELGGQFSNHHHHLTCSSCGFSQPIDDNELENALGEIGQRHGFQVVAHQVEISGRCPDCLGSSNQQIVE